MRGEANSNQKGGEVIIQIETSGKVVSRLSSRRCMTNHRKKGDKAK
jgi:hypothetical protein